MKFKEMITTVKIKRRRRTRGSVMLEIALTMPFLLWVMFAICEYGIALNSMNTITQLTRDGARYAAVHATQANCYLLTTDPGGDKSLRAFMINESSQTSIKLTDASIETGYVDDDPTHTTTYHKFVVSKPATPGDNVAVRLTYDMTQRLWASTASIVPGIANLAQKKYQKVAVFIIEKP